MGQHQAKMTYERTDPRLQILGIVIVSDGQPNIIFNFPDTSGPIKMISPPSTSVLTENTHAIFRVEFKVHQYIEGLTEISGQELKEMMTTAKRRRSVRRTVHREVVGNLIPRSTPYVMLYSMEVPRSSDTKVHMSITIEETNFKREFDIDIIKIKTNLHFLHKFKYVGKIHHEVKSLDGTWHFIHKHVFSDYLGAPMGSFYLENTVQPLHKSPYFHTPSSIGNMSKQIESKKPTCMVTSNLALNPIDDAFIINENILLDTVIKADASSANENIYVDTVIQTDIPITHESITANKVLETDVSSANENTLIDAVIQTDAPITNEKTPIDTMIKAGAFSATGNTSVDAMTQTDTHITNENISVKNVLQADASSTNENTPFDAVIQTNAPITNESTHVDTVIEAGVFSTNENASVDAMTQTDTHITNENISVKNLLQADASSTNENTPFDAVIQTNAPITNESTHVDTVIKAGTLATNENISVDAVIQTHAIITNENAHVKKIPETDASSVNENMSMDAVIQADASITNENIPVEEVLEADASSANENTLLDTVINADALSANESASVVALIQTDASITNKNSLVEEVREADASSANENTLIDVLIQTYVPIVNENTPTDTMIQTDSLITNESTVKKALATDASSANENTSIDAVIQTDTPITNENTPVEEGLEADASSANENTLINTVIKTDVVSANENTSVNTVIQADALIANENNPVKKVLQANAVIQTDTSITNENTPVDIMIEAGTSSTNDYAPVNAVMEADAVIETDASSANENTPIDAKNIEVLQDTKIDSDTSSLNIEIKDEEMVVDEREEDDFEDKIRIYIVIYGVNAHCSVGPMTEEFKKGLEVEMADVTVSQIPEVYIQDDDLKFPAKPSYPLISPNQLADADCIIFEFPTHCGTMAPQVKTHFDSISQRYQNNELANRKSGFFPLAVPVNKRQETENQYVIGASDQNGMVYLPIIPPVKSSDLLWLAQEVLPCDTQYVSSLGSYSEFSDDSPPLSPTLSHVCHSLGGQFACKVISLAHDSHRLEERDPYQAQQPIDCGTLPTFPSPYDPIPTVCHPSKIGKKKQLVNPTSANESYLCDTAARCTSPSSAVNDPLRSDISLKSVERFAAKAVVKASMDESNMEVKEDVREWKDFNNHYLNSDSSSNDIVTQSSSSPASAAASASLAGFIARAAAKAAKDESEWRGYTYRYSMAGVSPYAPPEVILSAAAVMARAAAREKEKGINGGHREDFGYCTSANDACCKEDGDNNNALSDGKNALKTLAIIRANLARCHSLTQSRRTAELKVGAISKDYSLSDIDLSSPDPDTRGSSTCSSPRHFVLPDMTAVSNALIQNRSPQYDKMAWEDLSNKDFTAVATTPTPTHAVLSRSTARGTLGDDASMVEKESLSVFMARAAAKAMQDETPVETYRNDYRAYEGWNSEENRSDRPKATSMPLKLSLAGVIEEEKKRRAASQSDKEAGYTIRTTTSAYTVDTFTSAALTRSMTKVSGRTSMMDYSIPEEEDEMVGDEYDYDGNAFDSKTDNFSYNVDNQERFIDRLSAVMEEDNEVEYSERYLVQPDGNHFNSPPTPITSRALNTSSVAKKSLITYMARAASAIQDESPMVGRDDYRTYSHLGTIDVIDVIDINDED